MRRCEQPLTDSLITPPRPCLGPVSRRCEACGRAVCALHWRTLGWDGRGLETCLGCWEAGGVGVPSVPSAKPAADVLGVRHVPGGWLLWWQEPGREHRHYLSGWRTEADAQAARGRCQRAIADGAEAFVYVLIRDRRVPGYVRPALTQAQMDALHEATTRRFPLWVR